MCTNATKTAATLMAAIEPTLKSLLTYTGQLNTTAGQAAITAYDTALAAIQNWKSGTTAQEVLQLVQAFQSAFALLPLPANVEALGNIILAGIETVIGVISANSPAPAPAAALAAHAEPASPEETQAMHQAHVIADTTAKLNKLVPHFKRSIWHSPASQYKATWNDAVKSNKLSTALVAA
jgi:hypothetical protein